ncbi:CueP family metal-binding protein [Kineosporia sp. J2-2]|uniref:CueP family metal-binding protein n=1 Tax=Kineosporia corallincola TaxID=2835133 RepID=A0ABS5TQD3_9ACTN|nr:CueP family metal-binding protein [Kineosporia corallincola]MBT0773292.1 CueP family metal-binding protein [Kineosporia corallincola]
MRSSTRVLTSLVAVAGALALLAGCSSAPTAGGDGGAWLSGYGIDGLDAREVISRLDATAVGDRAGALRASVRPDVLLLSDDQGHETSLDLPEDQFYLSVAPYLDETHECFFHSLTTCKGEMGDQDVEITVTDKADGSVVLEQSVRTYDNGFAGVWLPRDIEATLTVRHADGTATLPIGTGDDDPTCLTTARLA